MTMMTPAAKVVDTSAASGSTSAPHPKNNNDADTEGFQINTNERRRRPRHCRHHDRPQQKRQSKNDNRTNKNSNDHAPHHHNNQDAFGQKRGWSKPTAPTNAGTNSPATPASSSLSPRPAPTGTAVDHEPAADPPPPPSSSGIGPWKIREDVEDASKRMGRRAVQEEMLTVTMGTAEGKEWSVRNDEDDTRTTTAAAALATTAAAVTTSLTSALGGGVGDDNMGDDNNDQQQRRRQEQQQDDDDDDDITSDAIMNDFASFAKGQSMAALMADLGTADPDWKKRDVDDGLVVDKETKESVEAATTQTSTTPTTITTTVKTKYPSMLGRHGKAPIHVILISFGYVHGAPSRNNSSSSSSSLSNVTLAGGGGGSWSPHTQPMAPVDLRVVIPDSVPHHLLWHDGLRSAQVKRILLSSSSSSALLSSSMSLSKTQTSNIDDDDNDDNNIGTGYSLPQYVKQKLVRSMIWPKLMEAQKEGGHGYVSPATLTFFIGSHLGRHRSVVAVELAAKELRTLLRNNQEGVVPCPVSVATHHRDVERRPPNLKSTRKGNTDDDDFDNDGDNR